MTVQQTMHVMRQPFIEKVVLSAGATGPDLERAKKLLEIISTRKAYIIAAGATRRIPAFGVKPGLELGTAVTVRGAAALELLRRLLGAVDNSLATKQVAENQFSFGIHEYIEIPGVDYVREIGIRGFNVTVVFVRRGVRVKRRKIKRGRLPRKQHVTPAEIMSFMEHTFKTRFT